MANFDCILRGGMVVDGTGSERFPADVGLVGDRITAIGDLSAAEAARMIDARRRVVAPGFVDVHNHSEGWLLKLGHLAFKTRQGVTTEVLMSDGISYVPLTLASAPDWIHYLRSLNFLEESDYRGWSSIEDYLRLFEQAETRIAQNVAVQVPFANVRAAVAGWGSAPATSDQRRQVRAMIEEGMRGGAVGLSTGLDYVSQCFSNTDELVFAASCVAPWSGLYVTHIRYNLGIIEGLAEAVEIAKRGGARLHVSHLKTEQADMAEPLLSAIDKAALRHGRMGRCACMRSSRTWRCSDTWPRCCLARAPRRIGFTSRGWRGSPIKSTLAARSRNMPKS
jgi:N-acyl-D-amino-acid deacylase